MIEIVLILLICVSNFLFAYCGYLIGRKHTIITVEKGDKVQVVTMEQTPSYEDEEAFVPEEESDMRAKV